MADSRQHRSTSPAADRHGETKRLMRQGWLVSPAIGAVLNVAVTLLLGDPSPSQLEWHGDNYGTVNVYPDRCEAAGLSGDRSTVPTMPDELRPDAPPTEWGVHVHMHSGETHHFLTTENDAHQLASRLSDPQREVKMFSEGSDGEPTTHVIRGGDVTSVEVKHEPAG